MLITSEAYVDIDMVPVTEVRLAAEIAKGIKFELTPLSPKPPSSQNLDPGFGQESVEIASLKLSTCNNCQAVVWVGAVILQV